MLESLQRIEGQLISAARRDIQHRHRRRRLALPTVAVAGLLMLSSGASAVTGVGPVGELFHPSGEPSANIYPPKGAPQTLVEATTATGVRWSARAFESTTGGYCVQVPPPGVTATVGMSCAPAAGIEQMFGEGKPLLHIASVRKDDAESLLIAGITPANTTSVAITDDEGRTAQARLSHVWTRPHTPQARAFLVATPWEHRVAADHPLSVTITTADGAALTSHWP